MSVETFTFTLYECGCGYNTSNNGNASKHKKTKCGHEIIANKKEFVLKEVYDDALGKTNTIDNSTNVAVHGDNNTTNTNIMNVTLVLPQQTTKEDMIDYLGTLEKVGFRSAEDIALMPGKILTLTRGADKYPGALIERNKKIVEKLPDGSERVMAKKKAVQTYTHEAIEAMCLRPPADGVVDFLETERGSKRTKISIQDAAKLRVTNPRGYHNGVPEDVKTRHQTIENHTEDYLDKITLGNKTNGFL
jgi:hypothetical protein